MSRGLLGIRNHFSNLRDIFSELAQLRGGVAMAKAGRIDAFSRKIIKSFLTLANSKNIVE